MDCMVLAVDIDVTTIITVFSAIVAAVGAPVGVGIRSAWAFFKPYMKGAFAQHRSLIRVLKRTQFEQTKGINKALEKLDAHGVEIQQLQVEFNRHSDCCLKVIEDHSRDGIPVLTDKTGEDKQ